MRQVEQRSNLNFHRTKPKDLDILRFGKNERLYLGAIDICKMFDIMQTGYFSIIQIQAIERKLSNVQVIHVRSALRI